MLLCRDPKCSRPACQFHQAELREEYDEGFTDGIAACPLSHEG